MSIAWMAMGVGGVTGCIAGGYLTQYCHPKYTFVIVSIVGLIIALISTTLTKESEKNENDLSDQEENFIAKLNQNLSQIGQAIQMPEIYLVISFFVLNGLFSPSFG